MGYAKDIAAGMVSLSGRYKVKRSYPKCSLYNLSLSKAYLHSMNVIHRDLNSHNCLVRQVNKWFHYIHEQTSDIFIIMQFMIIE